MRTSMQASVRTWAWGAGLCLALLGSRAAIAGGGEQHCYRLNGVLLGPVAERWPAASIPLGGVPWIFETRDTTHAGGPRAIPGYPAVSGEGACPGDPLTHPGVRTVVEAAELWSTVETWNGVGPTGNPIHVPTGASPRASSFRISTTPTLGIPTSVTFTPPFAPQWTSAMLYTQGGPNENVLTFWEHKNFWSPVGGAGAVVATIVTSDVVSGDILDCDIAFNCTEAPDPDQGSHSPRPSYSFVAEGSNVEGTSDFLSSAASTPGVGLSNNPQQYRPSYWYVDLLTAATHNFGHLAGLAHSLVDSTIGSGDPRSPSMFAVGSTVPRPSPTWVAQACNTGVVVTNSATSTASTRILGMWSKGETPLELDDVSALAALYPAPAFAADLGEITGRVVDPSGQPLSGASVVAFSVDNPDVLRVGELTYANGTYRLPGLTPGDYYLRVEAIDVNPNLAADPAYFHDDAANPTYVWQGGSTTAELVSVGCVGTLPNFEPELWNVGDAELEPVSAATRVTVAAGQVLTLADAVVMPADGGDDAPAGAFLLEIAGPGGGVRWTPRGLIDGPFTPPGTSFQLRLRHGEPFPAEDLFAYVYFYPERENALQGGQLRQITMASPNVDPLTAALVVVPLEGVIGTPTATSFDIPTSFHQRNLFAQARIVRRDEGGTELLGFSNVVSLMFPTN